MSHADTGGARSAVRTAPGRTTTAEVLAAENHRLRQALDAAEDRARLAEEQLLRVHRAVRAAQQGLRDAKQKRNQILATAQQHATELIRQAQEQAASIASGSTPEETFFDVEAIGSRAANWADSDPSLDDRLEEFLQNDLEPDRSREWMLGDRSG